MNTLQDARAAVVSAPKALELGSDYLLGLVAPGFLGIFSARVEHLCLCSPAGGFFY